MADGVRDRVHGNACQLCGTSENLQLCGGCKSIWYCCKDHQRYDWKYHKVNCKKKRNLNIDHSVPASPENVSTIKSSELSTMNGGGVFRQKGQVFNDCDLREQSRVSDLTTNASRNKDSYLFVNNEPQSSEGFKPGEAVGEDTSVPSTKEERQSLKRSISEELSLDCIRFLDSVSVDDTDSYIEGSSERTILETDASELIQPQSHSQIAVQAGEQSLNQTPIMPPMGSDPSNAYLSVIESRNISLAEYVVNCLSKYGLCVIDDFLGQSCGENVLKDVKMLHKCGTFNHGQVVDPTAKATRVIRSDMITWISGKEKGCDHIQFLISAVDAIMLKCGGKLQKYSINGRTKAMVACYPGGGTHYMRHVDNPNRDGRCVTSIYYLNKDWNAEKDGGLLRIYPENHQMVASVEPKFDRLIFFWSDRRNPHEVMPAHKTRYAITVWYYDAEERRQAVKRLKKNSSQEKDPVPLSKARYDN